MALRKCIDCKHCKSVIEHYENVPKIFSSSLEFYCLKKDNKYLGSMVKQEGKVEYLDCFEEREEAEQPLEKMKGE